MVVTSLNSGNDKKLERMLENSIIKYENASNDMERFKYKLIIDEIYAFEIERARKACKKLDRSIGFAYFLENYNNHEKCLNYFSSKIADDILNFKEDTESLIHDSYKTYHDFVSSNPRTFLINIISKYDKDLSRFMQVNIGCIDSIDNYMNLVRLNWNGYEADKADCKDLISKLDSYYYENNNGCICPKIDIYIYLFKNNDMIEEFKKFYVMEDTNEDEFNELIENSDIYDNKLNMRDIKLISEMDKIIKENIKKKGKRLKI